MEKIRTIHSRAFYLISCHRYYVFKGHKEYEESIILTVKNDGGTIDFVFTDSTNNENISFINPPSGEYIVPLKKGEKMKLVITAKGAKGSYKIAKKIIK